MRKNFNCCNQIVKGSISCFFDCFSSKVFFLLLKKKIKDKKILSLIFSGLKTKLLVPSFGKIKDSNNTFLQGDILHLLFSNIYLHELDTYVLCRLKIFNSYKGFPFSQKYTKTAYTFLKKKMNIKLNLTPSSKFAITFKLIKYIRYADDFLLGLTYSQKETKTVLTSLKIFLKKQLNLKWTDSNIL